MSQDNVYGVDVNFSSRIRGKETAVLVDTKTGTVRVWDKVGKLFTTCHDLTPSQRRTLKRKAKAIADKVAAK